MQFFNPRVSIIIPVYNGSEYMCEAIDSALCRSHGNTEVLVINDGSCDGGKTESEALSYGGKIRYFSKPNGGVASALNLGIREMRGEYFSWLSHDDKYFPGKISEQIKLLSEAGDKTAVVFSGWAVIDREGKEIYRVMPLDRYTREQLDIPLFALLHGMINGCSLLIHKSHFERAGVFDESLTTTQDFDLWFRIMRNAKLICHEGALSMTRVHKGQDSRTQVKKHSEAESELWIKMTESLTEREKCDSDGTVYDFYKNIYGLLLRSSTAGRAVSHARRKACEELAKENKGIVYMIKAAGLYLSGYTSLVKAFVISLREAGVSNTVKRVITAVKRSVFR